MKIKLSDYVAEKAVSLGIKQVFMVTGGGAMHLNQSLGNHRQLNVMFNHHEQACAMAAEGYARLSNQPALVNVTTGPGSTNTLTGVHGAWTDSIPMVIISGQVKTSTVTRIQHPKLRQLGDQEIDVCSVVNPICKYAHMVTDPSSIRYHLEKAYYLSTHLRYGPTWLDIPIDVQSAPIDPTALKAYEPPPSRSYPLAKYAETIVKSLQSSKRPVVLLGSGVRLSGTVEACRRLLTEWQIPVVTGWNAHDSVPTTDPFFVGKPGTVGDRSGNFAVQNADLLIVLGCRLNIRQIGYNWNAFAKRARLIMVDIDGEELTKPTLKVDVPIEADLRELVPLLLTYKTAPQKTHTEWLKWCKDRQERYPVVLQEYGESTKVNPYFFMKNLFDAAAENQVFITANGTACVVGFQASVIKRETRIWTNSGCASMGYALPAAIGACLANKSAQTICITGDGSIMMNLQELQTIVGNQLPIKIFILNNLGYASIYQTHRNFFGGKEIGASPKSGVNFPNFEALMEGFGIPYIKLGSTERIKQTITHVFNHRGPMVCEVMLDPDQAFAPKVMSKQLPDGTIVSAELDDMAPFLSATELMENRLDDS